MRLALLSLLCAFLIVSSAHGVWSQATARIPDTTGRTITTDETILHLTLRKLYGTDAGGVVYLKAPGRVAVPLGRYEMKALADGAEWRVNYPAPVGGTDAQPGLLAAGAYIVAQVPEEQGGYIEVTGATLSHRGRSVGTWSGHARSRRTFSPPALIPLEVTASPHPATVHRPSSIALRPDSADRVSGLALRKGDTAGAPFLSGDGSAEWWVYVPVRSAYRASMRYAEKPRRPCDIVIDGDDLNDYNMCALNATDSGSERDALWEYQGSRVLEKGVHWIRVQDRIPSIYGIRLTPVDSLPARKVPEGSFSAPASGRFLGTNAVWKVGERRGSVSAARVSVVGSPGREVDLSAAFGPGRAEEGASVRLVRTVRCSIEPFGRLRFRFTGTGSQHVVSLRVVDAKGDEKLLWRARDTSAEPKDVVVPISFEGNDVFDPAHVTAICLELDEGNASPGQGGAVSVVIADPLFDRRDALVPAPGSPAARKTARSLQEASLRSPAGKRPAPLVAPLFTPWTRPVVPEEHPLCAAATPKPVTRATLGYGLHFTGARDVSADALDQFHTHYRFGDVCWPHIGILPQRRDFKSDGDYRKALAGMGARLQEVNRRGLFVFDIWGYVPFGEAGPTPQVAPEHHQALLRIFGDRFLGYDNGEQDGRYIGAYADRGAFTDRRGGWADFVKWDEGICRDSQGYMDATGSLNFSHYYGERGCRMLGLETAQGLPSDTLMFAFLRGAAKQYGRLTTQATSIWNRFGYNMYHDRRTDGGDGYGLGPNKGCSLGLHKRLFFSSYTGGDSICGTETSQFTADKLPDGANELSPLGRQHLRIADWVKKHPDRGVMYTPVAFMLDFYNGWNMPRHLYRGDRYKVWGKLPYEKGDYLIDRMFRLVWPGYQDASYLRNERGFLCPTPFGDIFDVVTNRCHPDVLKQYAALVLLGDVEMTPEVARNLAAYVRAGGDLVVDARAAKALPEDLAGVRVGEDGHKGRISRVLSSGAVHMEQPFTYTQLTLGTAAPLLLADTGDPVMTVNRAGKGRVVVVAADYWMTDRLTYAVPEIVNMEPPYRLLDGVREVLSTYFGSFSPVRVDPGLTVRTCLYQNDPKRMLVGLLNNDLFADWKGEVKVRRGTLTSARELWHDVKLTPGERGIPLTIPAGDVAMVEVRLR